MNRREHVVAPLDDEHFMRAALEQAVMALAAGNLPIGCVVVCDGLIVALGQNGMRLPPDDTRHAELQAMQSIAGLLVRQKGRSTLYTTLEPCMMCLGAMVNVGIGRLVVGARDERVGALALMPHKPYYRDRHAALRITDGVLAAESRMLLDRYARQTGPRAHLARG